jgi:hypothetical protein
VVNAKGIIANVVKKLRIFFYWFNPLLIFILSIVLNNYIAAKAAMRGCKC